MELLRQSKKKCIPQILILNPLTPMSDQDRISPFNINTIPTRYVLRMKKDISLGVISFDKHSETVTVYQSQYNIINDKQKSFH